MPSLYPESGIEYYFKTCKKGDPELAFLTEPTRGSEFIFFFR
jgi:hypothetical protein